MTSEARGGLPTEVVEQDHALEQGVQTSTEELARLRWHWTLDETNPNRLIGSTGKPGFALYGESLKEQRSGGTIRQYARGHELRMKAVAEQGSLDSTLPSAADAVHLMALSEKRRVVAQAVAEAHGLSVAAARGSAHKTEVSEVRDAVDEQDEKRETEGKLPLDNGERLEYARKLAKKKKEARERLERAQRERKTRHTAMFIEVDARISRARRELKIALDEIRGVTFTDEEVVLLERQSEAAVGMARFVHLALTNESGVDWDAELAELEERRQYGPQD